MPTTLLLTVQSDDEDAAVRATGVEVLARYPDAMLVRATGEQTQDIERLGVEAVPPVDRPVVTTGNSFAFADAVQAQEAAAIEPPPGRPSYHLLKLAGPLAPEWKRRLQDLGVRIHDNLSGFTLLVGLAAADRLGELRALPWVEDVTPYRAAMKLSPGVRAAAGPPPGAAAGASRGPSLGVAELASASPEAARPAGAAEANGANGAGRRLVEVSVFAGESVDEVAARLRGLGATVLSATDRGVVTGMTAAEAAELAGLPEVLAIRPYAFPEAHNDQARQIMGVSPDNFFRDHTLTGADEIVGIADSGLDTGDPDTIHTDIRGRVAGISSWATNPDLAAWVNDPPGHDDGPADQLSGHGTHVTGSVLGDGSAARAAGATTVPAGVAPGARVFFQAVGQRVDWKSEAQIVAEGGEVPSAPWPPDNRKRLSGLPTELTLLFVEARRMGARVHTNSWGGSPDGGYNDHARAVDDFVWRHPDMLIVFSAGNAGVDVDGDGVIDERSVTPPGTAKNCLTVGACENRRPPGSTPPPAFDLRWDEWKRNVNGTMTLSWPHLGPAGHVSDDPDGMAAFSSRGPVDRDRIKPDVVAPGTNVLSTLSSAIPAEEEPLWGRLPAGDPLRPHYCWSGGTSMAAPLVAGAAALVRRHLISDREHVPSSALLKAFLVTGAAPVAGQFLGEVPTGVNPVSGFGRIDVGRTVGALSASRPSFADDPADAVTTGERRIYRIEDVDPAAPLVVTLVWTDAPAEHGGLVNELYLRLQAPDGTWIDGDLFAYPHAVNNVQRIVVSAPAGGTYAVHVIGVSVLEPAPGVESGEPGDRQDFAIVAAGGRSLIRTR